MGDMIKVTDPQCEKYEEVLLRRDNLRKEAELYHLGYIKIFGDLITESFRLKVECIRKKKMITYCQRLMNLGKDINSSDLTKYIETEMAEYQKELQDMIDDVKAAKGATPIMEADVRAIKKIYYALVKLIHPDMHPELAEDKMLKDYWTRIVTAYRHNDLKELQELDMLVRMYLSGNDIDTGIKVDDIETRIREVEQEIENILSTDPYLYKLLLADPKEIEERKQGYKDDIESYTNYSREQDGILESFEIKEMLS